MSTMFAALLYRTSEVSLRALCQGFAVALAGYDVPAPRLSVAEVPGLFGYSVAFYESGATSGDDELEHVCELFEDELSPPALVQDAAALEGQAGVRVYALIYAEDVLHDDGMRFDDSGFLRRFVREGEDGLEYGEESPDEATLEPLLVELDDDASDEEERLAFDGAARPRRGSTFLAAELRAPLLASLMGALFAEPCSVAVRLVEPDAASIREEVLGLCRALGRQAGRGAWAPQPSNGAAAPASYVAFVAAYDWHDPDDAEDLYRELSMGLIVGTLRFLRPGEASARLHAEGHYPVAELVPSALGRAASERATLSLSKDGETLFRSVAGEAQRRAGPTFGELLRYLALGWKSRTDAEEEMIGALMLRGRVSAEQRR